MDAPRHTVTLIDNATSAVLATLSLPAIPKEGERLRLGQDVVESAGLYKIDVVVHAVTTGGEAPGQLVELYVSRIKSG